MTKKWILIIITGVLATSLLGSDRAVASTKVTYVRHPAEIRAQIIDLIKSTGQEIGKFEDKVITTKYKYVPVEEIRELSAMPNKSEASGFESGWLWARFYEVYRIEVTENGGTRLEMDVRPEAYNASGARWIRFQSNGTSHFGHSPRTCGARLPVKE